MKEIPLFLTYFPNLHGCFRVALVARLPKQ